MKILNSLMVSALASITSLTAHAGEGEFLELCRNVEQLPQAQKKTVQTLIKVGSGPFAPEVKSCEGVLEDLKTRKSLALPGRTFEYLNVADVGPIATLDWIEELDLTNQSEVTDVTALSQMSKLQKLSIVGTHVILEQLTALSGLRSLEIGTDPLTYLGALARLPVLEDLSIVPYDAGVFLGPLADAPSLKSLRFESGGVIEGLNRLSRIERLTAVHATLDAAQLTHLPLTTLALDDGKIKNVVSIAALRSLQTLRLSKQGLDSVAFLRPLTQMRHLNLSENQIDQIDALSGMTGLQTLNLSKNLVLYDTAIRKLTQLETIDLSYNRLSFFFLDPFTKIQKLSLAGNSIHSIDIKGPQAVFASLVELDASSNNLRSYLIREINGSRMPALKQLNVSGNKISDVDTFATLLSLETLNLDDNKIVGDLSALAPLQNLKSLSARYNLLTDLSCPVQPQNVCDFLHQEH